MAENLSYNPYRDMHDDVQLSAMFFGKNIQNIPIFNPTQTIEVKRLYYSLERFTFTGKERDSETGFSYFGARYYDSDLMTGWLSVDPMADKYPNISPYAYCAWNPVKLVDPDGRTIWIEDGSGTKIEYKVNMDPVGDKEASKQIGLLNEMYSTDLGMELLDVLIESNNDYYITNESPSVIGTCNTTKYGNGAKLKMGGNNELLNISHELFHAYQYESGFGGATYRNEVEAYLFSIALTQTKKGCSTENLKSRNPNTTDGIRFEKAMDNLMWNPTFLDADFRTAVDLFQAESNANSNGTYNTSYYKKGEVTNSLLSNFYPLMR